MILVKYCEEQYNITKSCNTLQLGTFEYYRDMDSNFSIADSEEGYLHISANSGNEIEVSYEKWNQLFGRVLHIDSDNTVRPGGGNLQKIPGDAYFTGNGGNFILDGDRKILKFNSNFDFKFYYPNSYIFCLSVVNNVSDIDPINIDSTYNSHYVIPEEKLHNLTLYISNQLINNICLADLGNLEFIQKNRISDFMTGMDCFTTTQYVDYVDETRLVIEKSEDFDKNKLLELYLKSLFTKNNSYSTNKELRIVFSLRHKSLGLISVKKDPLLIDLKPILNFLGT